MLWIWSLGSFSSCAAAFLPSTMMIIKPPTKLIITSSSSPFLTFNAKLKYCPLTNNNDFDYFSNLKKCTYNSSTALFGKKYSVSKDDEDDGDNKFEFDLEEGGNLFGPLLPFAKVIYEATGGWGVSYADLSPQTPRTFAGASFLLTNVCYAVAGVMLTVHGDVLFGAMTEIAGVVSFIYHYLQLDLGKDRNEVRLALVIDYITAGVALITGTLYIFEMGFPSLPFECVLFGVMSLVSLSLSWVWEFGIPYIFWHSLWHIFSALSGYLIGETHLLQIN